MHPIEDSAHVNWESLFTEYINDVGTASPARLQAPRIEHYAIAASAPDPNQGRST